MEKMQKLTDEIKLDERLADDSDATDLDADFEDLNVTDDQPPKLQPRPNVKIVAIDLQPMAPLEGITQLQADITSPSTIPKLLSALNPSFSSPSEYELVDLVISDGAPDVTGLHDLDIHIQSQLLYSALCLAIRVLRPGGKFVAKIFRGKDVDLIYAQLKVVFEKVSVAKPRSSRASSVEAFVVGEGFRPIPGWVPELGGSLVIPMAAATADEQEEISNLPQQARRVREDGKVELTFPRRTAQSLAQDKRWIPPFLSCGSLEAPDADATYSLPEGYVSLDPVQPPTAPPYKEAIERRRVQGGMFGKTGSRENKGMGKETS